MGVRIQELPETTGIKKEDVLIVEDGQGTKKGTVQQLDEALGVSQLKEDLGSLDEAVFEPYEKNVEWVANTVSSGTSIKSMSKDKTTKPIVLKNGETVRVKTKGDGVYLFNAVSSVPSIDSVIEPNRTSPTPLVVITGNTLTEYTYTATEDIIIILSVLDDATSTVVFENLVKTSKIDILEAKVEAIQIQPAEFYAPVELDFTVYNAKYFTATVGNEVTIDDGWNTSPAFMIIDVKAGEKYKIRGRHYYQASCYAVVDSNNICVLTDSGSGSDRTVFDTITIPINGSKMYISAYDLRYVKKSTIVGSVPLLANKKICYDGDSICETRLNNNLNTFNGGGYAKLISDRTGCDFINFAQSGGIICNQEASGTNYHSVVDTLPSLPTDADIYCFEGGINDYWTTAQLGTYSKTDYDSEVNIGTFCGALEYIFRYAINNFVGKAICYIIPHKITNTSYTQNGNGNTFEDYHDAIVGLCKKYGIPYYDAWLKSGLNGWNSVQSNAYLTSNSLGTGDGTHPNADGYKKYYVSQLIQFFESLIN